MPLPRQVRQFYYITHMQNLRSIMQRGVLSHRNIESQNIPFKPIYNSQIVSNRRNRTTPAGKSLWEYANLYFQPRNAMLFQVTRTVGPSEVAVLAISQDIMAQPGSFISMGNAASMDSEIVPSGHAKVAIKEISKWIDNEWWTEEVGLKRKMMAELLVPSEVAAEHILSIYVATDAARAEAQTLLTNAGASKTPVILAPEIFFLPARVEVLTDLLSVAEGDMFFSTMQTLTISVNTVGVMGKGLASRAKYQFPDVYVRYQDVCRAKKLRMGQPYLYKRESSLDYQLAVEPEKLPNGNGATWFLLFATKRHWREDSDIAGIEEGLNWVLNNYQAEGIKSLAMPALGCGLGRLKWEDVGPLMCSYLSRMEIPTRIYLPAEKKATQEHMSPEFLLARSAHNTTTERLGA